MSRLMTKLKRLEPKITASPDTSSPLGTFPRRGFQKNKYKNKLTVASIIVAVFFVGAISYFAGLQSGKGSLNVARTTGAQSSTRDSRSERRDPQPAETTKNISETGSISNRVVEDLTTLAFEENEIVPLAAYISLEKNCFAAPDKIVISEPTRPGADQPVGGSDAADSEKITALTAAINKAFENPITPEEDEQNKHTIQKLNILGIVKDDTGMTAIISGIEVREGDNISQFTVDEIAKDYVVFTYKRTFYKKLVR